jgi:hypothetical protein
VRYLYIKRNVEKVWGARYTLCARYILKNTVFFTELPTASLLVSHHQRENGVRSVLCQYIKMKCQEEDQDAVGTKRFREVTWESKTNESVAADDRHQQRGLIARALI